MEESIENLLIQIHQLQSELEEQKIKNNAINQNFYEIITQYNRSQEAFLDLSRKHKIMKYQNSSLLREMDTILFNKKKLEELCQNQYEEIDRAMILIKNYINKN